MSELLTKLNEEYSALHLAKEDAFWRDKMNLSSKIEGEFVKNEIAWQKFCTDPQWIKPLRESLRQGHWSQEVLFGLKGWLRFFECHVMENPDANRSLTKIITSESELYKKRRNFNLGYKDSGSGAWVPCSSIHLGLRIRTDKNEANRQSAFEGLRSLEQFALKNGFLEIVRERNALARSLGYSDYYEFKVHRNEGMSKAQIFHFLETLEIQTREAGKKSIAQGVQKWGKDLLQPWNFTYLTTGDLTHKMDPFFPFAKALEKWCKSFSALGIHYNGASLTLDLLDRKGKYENGFMHGPIPPYQFGNINQKAKINFTANAAPFQIGSGHRALETLFHEGGHAAHFANILMPAPCFSQEYAPTSVAFAETQSMFCDSLIQDTHWRSLYAKDAQGNAFPRVLMDESIALHQPWKVFQLRAMLTVCFAEKALYEMSDSELTEDKVIFKIREIEKDLQFINSGVRPVLSVPHLLSWESSAYYHGYLLAEMAVAQTRDFFIKRDGFLVNNPKIGPDLTLHYWQPGNSKSFTDFVRDLTGEEFSPRALIEHSVRSVEDMLETKNQELMTLAQCPPVPDKCSLNAEITLIHGDEIIGKAEEAERYPWLWSQFETWITKVKEQI